MSDHPRPRKSAADYPIASGRPRLARRIPSRRAVAMLGRNTVVSCMTLLFNLALLWVLVRLGWGKLEAAALGFIVANTIHYALGRAWIFAGTKRGLTSGYAYFLVNAVLGLAITLTLYAAFLAYTPINYIAARVLVSVFAGLALFLLNAILNFQRL